MVTGRACPAGIAVPGSPLWSICPSVTSTTVSVEPLLAHRSTPAPRHSSRRSSLRHSSRRSAESHRVAPRPRRKMAPTPPETMYRVCSARTGVPRTPSHPRMRAMAPIPVDTMAALRSHCFLARLIRSITHSPSGARNRALQSYLLLLPWVSRGLLVRIARAPNVGAGEGGVGPRPPAVVGVGLRPVQAVLDERVLALGEDQGTAQTTEGGPLLPFELVERLEEVLGLDRLVGRWEREAGRHE